MADGYLSGTRKPMKRLSTTLRREGPDRLFLYGIRYLSWNVRLHRRVRSLPHPVASAIYRLTKVAVRGTVRLLAGLAPQKYTDADPYKRVFVDPASIEYTSGASRRRGWVVDRKWEEDGTPFMQRPYPKAIEQRFVEGLEWEETALAEKYDGTELEERAEAIEALYRHIREDGYKSQRQLLAETPDVAWEGLNDAMHPLANEVAVDVGSDGELLWNMCGQHRLAIAKVLELDRIPVQVFRRHVEWQAVRNRARRGEPVPEDVRDHPDLADVLEGE